MGHNLPLLTSASVVDERPLGAEIWLGWLDVGPPMTGGGSSVAVFEAGDEPAGFEVWFDVAVPDACRWTGVALRDPGINPLSEGIKRGGEEASFGQLVR